MDAPERDWDEVGARILEIRTALGDTQEQFAERLKDVGLVFHKTGISTMESGLRELPRNFMPRLAELDPKRRGLLWLAFGPLAVEEERQRLHDADALKGSDGPIEPGTLKRAERRDKPRRVDRA